MTAFNTDSTLHPHTAHAATARRRSPWRAWSFHLAEMMIAMIAGMAVLGGALEGLVSLAGASVSDAPAAVMASIMAFNMTAPMVWWMRFRGHPARHNAEMAASMVVPTALVIALHWLGVVAADSVMLIQHVVMIPAMVGLMLARFEHYAH
jgi:flagellar biosynthetic protein FliP